jgi:N-glycosidase YbiA
MTVLNKHHGNIPADAIYIGRGSQWGNPYSHLPNTSAQFVAATRDEACDKHEQYLRDQFDAGKVTVEDLAALHGKDLVCYCAPQRCHGHTLERFAAAAYNYLHPSPITEFSGEYRWLSNFWPSVVELDGIVFQHVEGAYVAAKTLDIDARYRIQNLLTPGACKREGRKLQLRDDWENVKVSIMETLLRQKFAPDSDLARQLLATGDREIQEGNYWGDTFWGICKGRGQNVLGRLLMHIRNELRS